MASRLEVSSYRAVPAFFLAALRIHKQVRQSDGAIGVSLVARPLRRTFFTLSTWRDRGAVTEMVTSEPHASVMAAFRGRTSDATFVFWEERAGVRPDWDDALRRLDDAGRASGAGPSS
ncbi:DUF3291 domain-containing protein [uncultured Williamsia sp.]|uniref:DUF3291 domain-containing protein n=1 Tax=uncultured Williamsia sp. TaxID=259311 RepID=UPI0026383BEE|nr:DUF3291 domain-containing protein [uncultured Williamsia sp.]